MQTRVLEEEYIAGMGLKLMLESETWVMEELRDMVVEAESNHYEELSGELVFLGTERGENWNRTWTSILNMEEVKEEVMEGVVEYVAIHYETLPGERIFLGIGDMEIWIKTRSDDLIDSGSQMQELIAKANNLVMTGWETQPSSDEGSYPGQEEKKLFINNFSRQPSSQTGDDNDTLSQTGGGEEMMHNMAFTEIGADMDKTVNVRAEVSKAAADGGGPGHVMINTLVCDITGWAEEIHCVGELPYLYKEEEESNNIVNANLIEFGYNYMNQPTDGNFGSFDVEECVCLLVLAALGCSLLQVWCGEDDPNESVGNEKGTDCNNEEMQRTPVVRARDKHSGKT